MTPDQIAAERRTVVSMARRFIGTPYHHAGQVMGAGVDCVTLLTESFMLAGAVPRIEVPYYPPDWHMHRDAERYMEGLIQYCTEVPGPPERMFKPADILLFQFGRTFSHGALVEDWPGLIHAYLRKGVVRTDMTRELGLSLMSEHGKNERPRPIKSFCLTRWWECERLETMPGE